MTSRKVITRFVYFPQSMSQIQSSVIKMITHQAILASQDFISFFLKCSSMQNHSSALPFKVLFCFLPFMAKLGTLATIKAPWPCHPPGTSPPEQRKGTEGNRRVTPKQNNTKSQRVMSCAPLQP